MFTTGWRFRMKFPDKIFHTFVMLDMSGGPCQTPTPFVTTSKIIKNLFERSPIVILSRLSWLVMTRLLRFYLQRACWEGVAGGGAPWAGCGHSTSHTTSSWPWTGTALQVTICLSYTKRFYALWMKKSSPIFYVIFRIATPKHT